jgi:hypothetical protein
MPKRKQPVLDPVSQYERFREAAKEAELSNDEGAFERAFKAVAPKRKRGPSKAAKPAKKK